MKKDMQIYVKTAYLYWYSIGELRILAYGKSAVLREPSAARLDPSLQNGPPDRSASRSGPFGFDSPLFE